MCACNLPTVQLPSDPEYLLWPDCNQAALYSCPSCQQQELSHLKPFQVTDLDRKASCSSCKRSNPVRLWHCSCKSLWHVCSIHAAMSACPPTSAPATKPPRIAKDSSRKRKSHLLEMGSFEDILDDDLRYRAAKVGQGVQVDRDDVISLGTPHSGLLRPGCLSHNLRVRFASSLALC